MWRDFIVKTSALLCAISAAALAGAQAQPYHFPGKPAHLESGAYWLVDEFSEGENILDLNVMKFVNGAWRLCDVDGSLSCNNDPTRYLMWETPIVSPVDGEIASCWRNFPDNPNPPAKRDDIYNANDIDNSKIYIGGNHVNIITDDGKVFSLAHFAQGSIRPELCPNNAGNATFPPSVTQDGHLPLKEAGWHPEAYIPAGSRPKIKRGEVIGGAGNSGNSSAVHLHIQINPLTGTDGFGREQWGASMPMHFDRVQTQALQANAGPVTNLWSSADTTITASDDGNTLFRPAGKFADDIVFQRNDGQIHYWAMEAGDRAGGFNIGDPVGDIWTPVGAGNVDGKHHDDIVFMGQNGQLHYWSIKNGERLSGANIHTPLGAGWKFGGVGDVDGDGTDDLVFAKDGQVHYWKMVNGARVSGANIHTPVSAGWRIGGVGDIDNDGTDDIVWRHANGQVHWWRMKNGKRVAAANIDDPVGADWFMRDIGDVDHDGTDDIVWQRNSGQVHYWKMKNAKRESSWNIGSPVGGDWTLFGVGNVGTRP